MSSNFKLILLLCLLLPLAACHPAKKMVTTTDSIMAFGDFVQVTLITVPRQDQRAILKRVEDEMNYMQTAFHPWKTGPMGRTNQLLAAAGKFSANPSVIPLVRKAQRLAKESQGLFNPAIGNLVQLWGFHADFPPQGPPPAPGAIQKLVRQHPRMQDISISGIRMDNTNPAVRLDLSGIAKGYVLDFVMTRLQAEGVHDAMIDANGDLKVLGQHGNRPWHIGIRDPRGNGIIASLDARDGEGVFTSGDYENYYDYDGKRYCNIIDPRTGYPADKTRSVTVINRDGALADAAATALFVAGPKQWPGIASDMGVKLVMLIDSQGVIYMTPQMRKRITLEKAGKEVNVVSLP
ncbi:MAG: FAD:protein FMN transferase [Gammaproteobacteria bacterium]